MDTFNKALLGITLFTFAGVAQATVITLDFEGIAPYPNLNNVFIEDFYNGGTASNGNSGTNYGVSFSANSLLGCLNGLDINCSNGSRGGLAPESSEGALFFLSGAESLMNVFAGFDTGFSFNYVSVTQPGSVSVFDGLNGTGNLLATIDLIPNAGSCPGFSATFCPFSPIGVNFSGTAYSVSFAGVADQIVFDDITFGSDVPGGDPAVNVAEPGTVGLLGLSLLAFGAIRRRRLS